MTDSQAHPDPVASGESGGSESALSESALRSGVLEQEGETLAEPEWPVEPPADESPAGEPTDYPAGSVLGCTVADRGQLPAARVLRASFLHQHPGAHFVLLLIDRPESADPQQSDIITPADIGVDEVELARLGLACTAEQLRAVLRPRLLKHLLQAGSTVLYLEPTVQLFAGFDDVLSVLDHQRPVALVPKVLRPLAADGLRPSATDLAESGTFDPSAFAVCPGAEQLLESWAEQVRSEPTVGAFLDGVSGLVDHHVLRDPGVGLSVWNAAQRDLADTGDGQYTVDGSVLRSVHFDGFQPQRPWLLSAEYTDRPRILLSENPVLAQLCAAYRNALIGAGYTREEPGLFETLPDGSVLPSALRAEYLRAWLAGTGVPSSPFEPASEGFDPVASFLEWAAEPADSRQRSAGASRWTAAVWADDPVLQRDYPDPFGHDADAFHEWCVGVGIASNRVPGVAVHDRADRRGATLVDQLGVAVLGSGRLAQLIRATVRASGLPSADTPYYPVVLRCDQAQPVPEGRYVVDVRLQADGRAPAESVESWVLSEATRNAVRRAGGPATRVLSLPLPDPGSVDLPTRKAARARFELSDEFVIATFVDHCDERRENVLGLVSAFLAAFAERDDVRLLIGVAGAAENPEASERLRLATAGDSRVLLVEDDADNEALLAAVDCVASLHRGDGGDRQALRLLEVAAHGIPVVTGGHGAVAELLGPDGAKLLPCQTGGEPDADAAAAGLREVADDPDGTAEFGVAARDYLLSEHSVAQAGERLREQVEHAYRKWRTKWAKDRHGQLDDPLRPLLVARHALHRAPDVGVGSRNTVAPALRKAVLKALSHYDEHIRDVLRSLVDGVEQTVAELLRRQYDADRGDVDLDSVRAELAQLTQRQEQFDAQLLGTDDGMVRARADLADQHHRLRELEAATTPGQAAASDDRIDSLAERLDSLTGAVERTLDRIDQLERAQHESSREQEIESGVRVAGHDAAHALQRTDVLQRILLREHERNHGTGDGSTAPVLCDAGLLHLPADDALMLPWLSSHSTWDAESSQLIDSLLEPDGVFLDVGAYAGYQTVRVLSRLGNSGAVVAVEPSEDNRDLLRRNIEVNVPTTWGQRLVTVDAAAWDSQCELTVEPALSGGVAVRPDGAGTGDADVSTVRAVRLDKELENTAGLQDLKLSVVHVDVGGCVHRILGGLVRLLRRDRPSIVCSFTPSAIVQLGDDPAAALREFGTWGYDLLPVGRDQAVTPDELLQAIDAAASSSTVKLWLRPRTKGA